ncbi:hypothetical protein HNQ60_002371 [Povalibacter uvarum]|uniref:Chalcone isomerase N-terminal domain-containing protein n=1 Tax=Povalibacter uvarum TaxID=732238 RepID=A0A841HMI6_9GAMM|nr:hypothetical protein [Povalibacter uvarum]MBB6093490.1 hypothetical protein [Povalibacter uvarum]
MKKTHWLACLSLMSALATAPAQAQMVKFTAIWEVPGDNALLDQWYRRTHSQETLQSVGPWLSRYWSYRAHGVPDPVAKRFNVVSYRLTEMWYPNIQARDESRGAFYPLSAPPTDPQRFPGKNRIAQIVVPAIPTEKFLDEMPRDRTTYVRWVYFVRYPAGVSVDDGERWFLQVHAPQLSKLPGLRRFVSYKSADPLTRADAWVRMCELWFDDYDAWRAALLDTPPAFTAPRWSGDFPYTDTVSIFTGAQADMDFMREHYRVP